MQCTLSPGAAGRLLLLACLVWSWDGGGNSAAEARLQAPPRHRLQQQGSNDDPFSNVVSAESTLVYQQLQGAPNDTLLCYQADAAGRWPGARFVPFSPEDQALMIQVFRDLWLPRGPFVVTSFREYYPDPTAPPGIQESGSGVELTATWYLVVSGASMGGSAANTTWSWDVLGSDILGLIASTVARISSLGNWTDVGVPQIIYADLAPVYFRGNFTLHPLIHMRAALVVNLANPTGFLDLLIVNAVAGAIETALTPGIGTIVEVLDYTLPDGHVGDELASFADTRQGQPLILIEATMYRCRENATVPSPQCEEQVLKAVLANVKQSDDVRRQWQAVGIASMELTVVGERPPLPRPDNNRASAVAPQPWVPWHLDRIDQRSLPLDGKFTANATGTGVHVFVISSGVLGEHEEFGYMDGRAGFRVEAEWGYKGLQPLSDCPDYGIWYGFGTYSASLCCGLKLGPAKNATIHSVRFRDKCLSERGSAQPWSAGALPSALDLVLSKALRPAVVLLDTWWTPGGSEEDLADIKARLDLFQAADIAVFAGAGPVPTNVAPCDNLIANHPAVISVAASDTHDQRTFLGPTNSSCITLFAPSGGLGTGLIGASPAGPKNYTRVITRAFGAAAIAAGVAAQYLELYPNATAVEVRRALLKMATPGAVTGAGPASPTSLLFTNLTQAFDEVLAGAGTATSSGSTGGFSSGAIVAIAVAAAAAAGFAAVSFIITRKRRRKTSSHKASPSCSISDGTGWGVDGKQIDICRHPDGSEWVLGLGRYGKVYKALKDGVQVVAVKRMTEVNEHFREVFVKEMNMMKYVSRDANITQFFGAVVQDDTIMLVVEFMEGGDLREALSCHQLQWYSGGRDVILDALRGLHFLHVSGVVHHDIKSKNILLDRHGRAKLADVGLAQLGSGQASSKPGFVGTMAWAAPEAIMGEECSDKADIYSLGVVLWEVVTQETPQRGCLRDPDVPRECPREVADAIKACMQQAPALRPTARELHSLLQSCPLSGGDHGSLSLCTKSEAEPKPRMSSDGACESSKSCKGTNAAAPRSIASGGDPALIIPLGKIHFCTAPDGTRLKLGSGSFGKVYKVLLEGVHPLAAKVVEIGHNPVAHATFVREASLLWQLRHNNVVGLSGISISDGRGMLLMELLEGGSLYERLRSENSTTKQRVFGWYQRGSKVALDVARGLHYLHSFKVTHFDLKSANVLLDRQLMTAKVADVGLAKVMSCTHHSFTSEAGNPPGTFAYMAPELMAGTKCTMAVDIYSYGQLLWEICTGDHPVRGRMLALRVPEDCPQEVAELYMRCISIDPSLRPTARALVDELTLLQRPEDAPRGTRARAGAPAGSPAFSAQIKTVSINAMPMVSPFQALRGPSYSK